MISVPAGTGDIPCGYDICCADDIRFAYEGTDIISYGNAVYHIAFGDISLKLGRIYYIIQIYQNLDGYQMGMGIMICGLNGCGKSTLGKALAKEIGFHFIDNESLYFSGSYENPRSREEVEYLLMKEVYEHNKFIFAAVKGDYGKDILLLYDYIVLVEVPKEIRLERVRNRSFQKFGDRMLTGGDLYEQEECFFRMVESRPEDYVEKWVQTLNCPVIKVDGTKEIEENVAYIIERLHI